MRPEELIMKLEGCRNEAYQDVTGVWTVGFGSTGPHIVKGTVWTQAQCAQALSDHLDTLEKGLLPLIKVPVNEDQWAAIVSLVYNIGIGAFKNSTLLKRLNEGHFSEAANEFLKWDHAGGKEVKGLYNRRLIEQKLFTTVTKDVK